MSALSLLVPLAVLAALQDDPAKDLKSKDPLVRLGAVRAIEAGGPGREAEKLLLGALHDGDWEVVEVAAETLGSLQVEKAFDPLLDLALEGPIRRIRRASARSLGRIDPDEAYEKLARKLSSDDGVRACEAIVELAGELDGKAKLDPLEKALRSKEAGVRRQAARALVALAGKERPARLSAMLAESDVALQAFALDAAAAAPPSADLVAPVMELLARPRLDDVLVRRAFAALRVHAALDATGGDLVGDRIEVARVAGAGDAVVRARLARLIGVLGEERDGTRVLAPERALALLERDLSDSDAGVRAAAAGALRRVGTAEALDRAARLAAEDADGHVRLIAFEAVAALRGMDDDATRALALERLSKDADDRVRESAAVQLGVPKHPDVVEPLIGALADPAWGVAVCAAVSLGITHDLAAVDPLEELAASEDWRLRGAAVTGLAKLRLSEAVPPIIAALEDDEPLVWRTAWEFLVSVAHKRLDPKVKEWSAWWQENGGGVKLALPEEVIARRKELGYVSPADRAGITQIFQNLDVIVLESRGDHIENILSFLDLDHRLTRSGKVAEDGLHPWAVFVANCTGEITPEEAMRISWFVRSGGYLFGSCWAVHETIAQVYPGLVDRRPTRGQVLDDVPAYPCTQIRTYLDGVFPEDCRPIYHLEGAYLIDVLDPERVEVLLDSPECAETWGGGNLAAWFHAGHGVVLDSVNHFDLQGLETATGLKKPEDRQAYAIDHLGLTYAELRDTLREAFWKKSSAASEAIKDLSVIRVVTNFVRKKRIEEE